MSKQKLESFTLDVTDISRADLLICPKNLQGTIIQLGNPILSEIDSLLLLQQQIDRLASDERHGNSDSFDKKYQESLRNYNQDMPSGLKNIASSITTLLTELGKIDLLAETDSENPISTSNSNMFTHLAAALQDIKANRNIREIVEGYIFDDGKRHQGLLKK
jgi:hypothetical protein